MQSTTRTWYRIFVAVTPGLETLLVDELARLGHAGASPVEGGVELSGPAEVLWQICLKSRLAESVRVRLGKPFRAVTFEELRAGLARLAWAAYLPRGGPMPRLRVICRRSRLFHSDAVAERLAEVVGERLGCVGSLDPVPALLHLRLDHDQAQVSVEASGEPLHRRGYRTHVGKAPLRETLAAVLARIASSDRTRSLWDPFCGSGTVVLEAAAIRSDAAPDLGRRFAFEDWPTHDAQAFATLRAGLSGAVRPSEVILVGSDENPRELSAAQHNAHQSGLEAQVRFIQGDFATVAMQIPLGSAVASNLPYGRRCQGGAELHRTFTRFGRLLRDRSDLDPVVVLAGSRSFEADTGLPWTLLHRLDNRGLPVRLLRLTGRSSVGPP